MSKLKGVICESSDQVPPVSVKQLYNAFGL